VRERVGEQVDRHAAAVDLDRAPFVVHRRRNAAHDDVALATERGVGVQAIDDRRHLQREDAAAAAEDPFSLDAVAVVDARSERAEITLLPVRRRQRVAEEAAPDPVKAKVGKRLCFGERCAGYLLRVPCAAAAQRAGAAQRQAGRAEQRHGPDPGGCSGEPPRAGGRLSLRCAWPSLSWRAVQAHSYFRAPHRF
jgi:hypothetical protein